MHRQPGLKSTSAARARRAAWVFGVTLVLVGAPVQTRSETMTTSPASSAPALSTGERLMQLVPDQVGPWKRHKLTRAPRAIDGTSASTVEAEFRQGNRRVQVSVTQMKAPPSPPPVAPADRETASGRERSYAENGATVLEQTRKADGRTDVTVVRADGVAVAAHAIGVTASDLKAIAQGIKTAGP